MISEKAIKRIEELKRTKLKTRESVVNDRGQIIDSIVEITIEDNPKAFAFEVINILNEENLIKSETEGLEVFKILNGGS